MNALDIPPTMPTTVREQRSRRADIQPVYSIVAPVFNEVETLSRFYERVLAVMERLGEPFEIVLVDDGSTDGSAATLLSSWWRENLSGTPGLAGVIGATLMGS